KFARCSRRRTSVAALLLRCASAKTACEHIRPRKKPLILPSSTFNSTPEASMLLTVVIIVVVILIVGVAGLLGFAASKPNAFRIQRAASIKAPPERIFPLINDFHNWASWSPWEKLDPALKRTYSGAASGPGAIYEWEGNKKVGQGRMEIVESSPSSKITIEAHNTAEFTLDRQGDSTTVTLVM